MSELRRLGFIGDVHAEDERLARAIDVLSGAGAEVLVCVGDVVDGLGDLERVVALLREHEVVTVRGNHERWFLSNDMRELPDAHSPESVSESARVYLASLSPSRLLHTIAGPLLLCHGLGADDMGGVMPWDDEALFHCNTSLGKLFRFTSARFVLNGHTHRRMVRPIDDRVIINAGTLYREHDPSFGMIDFDAAVVRTWVFEPDLEAQEILPIPFDLEAPLTPQLPSS